jgi:hypothetical protein
MLLLLFLQLLHFAIFLSLSLCRPGLTLPTQSLTNLISPKFHHAEEEGEQKVTLQADRPHS